MRVLEARERVGGRTYSQPVDAEGGRFWLDLGGQWLGSNQPRMAELVSGFAIETFPTMLLAGPAKARRREYFEVVDETVRQAPRVQF